VGFHLRAAARGVGFHLRAAARGVGFHLRAAARRRTLLHMRILVGMKSPEWALL